MHVEWQDFSFMYLTHPQKKTDIFVSMTKDLALLLTTKESSVLFMDVTSFTTTNVNLMSHIQATFQTSLTMSCVNLRCTVS